jgi:hypothetical protein
MEGQNFQNKVGKSKFKFGHGWLDLWKRPKNIKGKIIKIYITIDYTNCQNKLPTQQKNQIVVFIMEGSNFLNIFLNKGKDHIRSVMIDRWNFWN